MGSGHNFKKFTEAILEFSNAQEWLEAKTEWELHAVYYDSSLRSCECGHEPINQISVIKNRDNGNEAEVGNVCVHKFMQLASRRIFAVLKRVQIEITKSLNPRSLELFVRRGAISSSEMAEYLQYWRKRSNMSDQQRTHKIDINQRVIKFWEVEGVRLAACFSALGVNPR